MRYFVKSDISPVFGGRKLFMYQNFPEYCLCMDFTQYRTEHGVLLGNATSTSIFTAWSKAHTNAIGGFRN